MIAQMAERLTTNLKVPSSSLRSGSNEIIFSITRHLGLVNIRGYVFNELLLRGAEAGFEPGT